MARNGTISEFSFQEQFRNGRFIGPALVPDALFSLVLRGGCQPGYRRQRDYRNRRAGGFAIAAAPAIVQFVGGTARMR